jgi:polyferredoxin
VTKKQAKSERKILEAAKKAARVLGVILALPFFIWLPLSFLPAIPSMIDVFGMQGLRIPTGIVIAGLMLAAFGFEDF